MVIVFGLIMTLGFLGWGLYRAFTLGRQAFLAWLQSFILTLPLIVILIAFARGATVNLVVMLAMLIGGTAGYILLGQQIRTSDVDATTQRTNSSSTASQNNGNLEQQDKTQTAVTSYRLSNNPAGTPDSKEKYSPSSTAHSSLNRESETTSAEAFKPATSANNDSPELAPVANLSQKEGTADRPTSSTQRMSSEDLQSIEAIFSIDTFFSTQQSLYYNGALFNGNLRGEPETVHHILTQRLEAIMGSKYRLFLMNDPQTKPIVLVFPTTNDPVKSNRLQWLFALLLFGITILTCMVAAAIFQGFDLLQSWERWPDTLFLVTGLMIILGGHEMGHWLMASRHQLRLSPPFFIPTWQIGSFGVITRFESVIPHRTALFDVAFTGPAVGGILSLFLFVLGLCISHQGSVFQLSPIFFQSSILVGLLARLTLGDSLSQAVVDVDPLVVVGWLGLLITAINLMPVGQLDGGRIVQAVYGRKVIRWTSIVTLIILAIATLFNPLALYWLLVILFLQREFESPQQNELTEPNDTRAALGLLALFMMAAMLLPLSPALASRLGIGG